MVLVRALDRLAHIAPPAASPQETVARTITLTERAAIIRAAIRGAGTIVLQDLLAGVRDRVVVAVTFLALLELMCRLPEHGIADDAYTARALGLLKEAEQHERGPLVAQAITRWSQSDLGRSVYEN